MNFDNTLIQRGQATGDTAVRDAGIYMYTTQAAATHDYWFDAGRQAYPASFPHRAGARRSHRPSTLRGPVHP